MSTYYKILKEDLNCRGFQYQEGLNIDTNEITPYECDNGLYFADAKHILSFYDYGTVIAEVEVPKDAVVYHFDDKSKANKIILKNLRPLWSVDTMEALIQEGVNFELHVDEVFYFAIQKGYLDIIKYLAAHGADVHDRGDYPLRIASENGHLDIVKYLVEQGADVHVDYDSALRQASYYGYTDIVKYLVEQGANIHAGRDDALRWAVSHGYLDLVKCLVEYGANIHALDDHALRYASENGHLEVVECLVEHGARKYCDFALVNARDPKIESYLRDQILRSQE